MIEKIRIGIDMLDPAQSLNQGERESGIRIISATGPAGMSEDRRSVSWQVTNRFKVQYRHQVPGKFAGELGDVFETGEFDFREDVRAKANAIVLHSTGDMSTQDYSKSRAALDDGLSSLYEQIAKKEGSIGDIMKQHQVEMDRVSTGNFDLDLRIQERIIRDTRLRLNPLMRIPLMASGSPEDCAKLFGIMEESRANLVVYLLSSSRALVNATVLKFPRLKQLVPALADEELQLAA